MKIVLDRRRSLATAQVASLEERRKTIAAKLQAVHDAVEAVYGKQKQGDFTAELCNITSSKRIKINIVKHWFKAKSGAGVTLTDQALLSGVVLPGKVINLVSLATSNSGCSEDPNRYYKDGSFQPLPVSEEERENIFGRVEIVAKSDEDAELYKLVSAQCNLATRFNKESGPAIGLGQFANSGNRIYAPYMEYENKVFTVKKSHFCVPPEARILFDEGIITL